MSKEDEDYLTRLHEHVRRLNVLLDDPHPGLSTWCLMYDREMQYVADAWLQPELLKN